MDRSGIRSYIFCLLKSSLVAMGRSGVYESSPLVPVFYVVLPSASSTPGLSLHCPSFCWYYLFPVRHSCRFSRVVVFLFYARGRTSEAGGISVYLLFPQLPLTVALSTFVLRSLREMFTAHLVILVSVLMGRIAGSKCLSLRQIHRAK